jgi:hypothetical protein
MQNVVFMFQEDLCLGESDPLPETRKIHFLLHRCKYCGPSRHELIHVWTSAYTPGDGQTSWVYSSNPVLHLYISCYVTVNKLVLSYLLLCLLPHRVSSKQTIFCFGSNRNKPKLDLFRFCFGIFRETKKIIFRFVSVFRNRFEINRNGRLIHFYAMGMGVDVALTWTRHGPGHRHGHGHGH